jgi:PAS domain S-box-containing protein
MWEGAGVELSLERDTPIDVSDVLDDLVVFTELSLLQIDYKAIINKAAELLANRLPVREVVICELSEHKPSLSVTTRHAHGTPRLYSQNNQAVGLQNKNIKICEFMEDVFIVDHENKNHTSFIKELFGDFSNAEMAVVKVPGSLRPWGFVIVTLVEQQKFKSDYISLLRIVGNTLAAFPQRSRTDNKIQIYNAKSFHDIEPVLQPNDAQTQNVQSSQVDNLAIDGDLAPQLLLGNVLAEAEKTHHLLLDSSLVGIYITLNDTITRCNDRFAQLFEYSKEELLGKKLDEILKARKNSESRYCMLTLENKKLDDGIRIIKTRTKKENAMWLKCVANTIDSSNGKVVLGNVIDITEQVKIEDSLLESEKELRCLSAQLINAQENERKRVASELHDGISQSLSSIKYKVEQSTNICGGVNCEVNSLKQFVVKKIQNAIEEVRRISMDLRPSILDDLGIVETIEWQLREYQSTHKDIAIEKYLAVSEDQIPENIKISIFRVLQEALNNISKHANANSIKVRFSIGEEGLQLSIEDDGEGIKPSILRRQPSQANRIGFGLKSMQERAKLTGGIFEIISMKPSGTCIQILWPVRQTSLRDQ